MYLKYKFQSINYLDFSNLSNRFQSVSSWRNLTIFLFHEALSEIPVPEEYTPGSVMEWLTNDMAVTVTPSQIVT